MKKQILRNLYFVLIIFLLFSIACEKAPNNGIPTYIKLVAPTLVTKAEQGSDIHGFTDLWIESEGSNLGAYEYPSTFAVYLAGSQNININPGSYYNGDPLERRIYAVIEPFDTVINFIQKDTITVQAVFKYRDNASFLYIEDFESTNNFDNVSRTDASATGNILGRAGEINLSGIETNKTALSLNSYLISNSRRTFIEFNLKSENFGGFGLQSASNPDNKIILGTFAPFSQWTTIYFNVTNVITTTNEGEYDFFIDVQKETTNTNSTSTYFDNLKIIQF